jgi:hypothetical protein
LEKKRKCRRSNQKAEQTNKTNTHTHNERRAEIIPLFQSHKKSWKHTHCCCDLARRASRKKKKEQSKTSVRAERTVSVDVNRKTNQNFGSGFGPDPCCIVVTGG